MSSPERLDPKYLMGYPPPLTPSQKRAAEMAQKYPGTSKRRKPSTSSITSSSHPLRQTSFPPENPTDRGYSPQAFSPGARSPSIDTMSLVSGGVAAAPIKKKRGRKPKNYNPDADAASVAGGVAPSVAASRTSARAGGASRASRGLSVDEDDDEDGGRGGLDVAVVARTNEEKEKENRYRAMLVGEFDSEQFRRFECWRSARLADSVVRRIVNQTLSQSVPASVILAVKSVTKIFAGEIIELARRVQIQWLEVGDSTVEGLPSPPASDGEARKERRRGPLTADHLREALRRYKLERKAGMVGLLGLAKQQNSSGVEKFGLRSMGRRLLK